MPPGNGQRVGGEHDDFGKLVQHLRAGGSLYETALAKTGNNAAAAAAKGGVHTVQQWASGVRWSTR